MSQVLINQYLAELDRLKKVGGTHRESVVREAFKDLLVPADAHLTSGDEKPWNRGIGAGFGSVVSQDRRPGSLRRQQVAVKKLFSVNPLRHTPGSSNNRFRSWQARSNLVSFGVLSASTVLRRIALQMNDLLGGIYCPYTPHLKSIDPCVVF